MLLLLPKPVSLKLTANQSLFMHSGYTLHLPLESGISLKHYHRFEVDQDTLAVFPAIQRGHSIILDRQLGACYVNLSTRQLMQRYNQQQLMDFSQTRYFYRRFNHSRKVPQINGELQFLPLNGTTHKNAIWIALHYVHDYEQTADEVTFVFLNEITCHVPYYGRQLDQDIHRCIAVGKIFRDSLALCACHFGYQLQLTTLFHESIIHRYDHCQCKLCAQTPKSLKELTSLLSDLEDQRSNFIYEAAQKEYTECPLSEFQWYCDSVKRFLKKLRRL
jgi:hypothetical protein